MPWSSVRRYVSEMWTVPTCRQCPVDACDFALKSKQIHEEEEGEDDEKPCSDHLKVAKGRVCIDPLTVHTEESNQEGHLIKTKSDVDNLILQKKSLVFHRQTLI